MRGDKDADGFYWGEVGGRSGYVPCNMVSEVQVDDERVAQELLKVGHNLIGSLVLFLFDFILFIIDFIWLSYLILSWFVRFVRNKQTNKTNKN